MVLSKRKLDNTIVLYIIMTFMFGNWLLSVSTVLENINWLIIMGLIGISYAMSFKNRKKISICFNEVIFYIFFLLNIILYGLNIVAIKNIFFLLLSIWIIYFFIDLYKVNPKGYDKFITLKTCIILNIYFVVNQLIILIQYFFPHTIQFLFSYDYASTLDNLTGMVGPGGTHALLIFYVLLAFINLYHIQISKHKVIGWIYFIFSFVLIFVSCGINDNTAAIPVYPVAIMIYFIITNKVSVKTVVKLVLISIFGITIFRIIYDNNADFAQLIDVRLQSKIEMYFQESSGYKNYEGLGDERIEIWRYVMNSYNGMGMGTGFITNFDNNLNLIKHLGMNDLSLITCMSGIWFYVAYVAIIGNKISSVYKFHKLEIIPLLCWVIVILIITIYTEMGRSPTHAALIALIAIILQIIISKNNKQN